MDGSGPLGAADEAPAVDQPDTGPKAHRPPNAQVPRESGIEGGDVGGSVVEVGEGYDSWDGGEVENEHHQQRAGQQKQGLRDTACILYDSHFR